MKKFLLFISVILVSCSKDDPKSNPDIKIPVGDKVYDQDGITIHEPSVAFEVIQYNTRMDTTRVVPDMVLSWGVAVAEGDSVIGNWSVSPTFKFSEEYKKVWDERIKMWIANYSITITDFEAGLDGVAGIGIKKLKSGKSYSREQAVKVNRLVKNFDVFRVNFGMSKAEVKGNELARVIPTGDKANKWLEKSPTIAFIDAPNEPYLNGYEFENDKLKYIHVIQNAGADDNTEYMSSDIRNVMLALAKRHNAPTPVFEQKNFGAEVKYKTNSKITWVQNGLKFTYGLRNLPVKSSNLNYYTLTYEKI